MEFTIISYYGQQNGRCGYCKNTESFISHGMHAYTMFAKDYQELIDRGWRRSGLYCYKPCNNVTCCPCYTIKCDALEFKLSKSHKKVLKRMNRFLRDGKKDKNEEAAAANGRDAVNQDDYTAGGIREEPKEPNMPICTLDLEAVAPANPQQHEAARREHETCDELPQKSDEMKITPDDATAGKAASLGSSRKSFDGINSPCKKAKQMRLERKQAKLAAKGITAEQLPSKTKQPNPEKTLSDYFAEASPTDKHKLQVILIPPDKKSVTDEAFNLYRKYQLLVHNDDPNRLTPTNLERFCYKSPLKLVHVKSQQFTDTLKITYGLYEKYQTRIHNDPPGSVTDYLEFLQESPLKYSKTRNGPATGYGSFHQQYWLDDKLIAVAVIDILPHCVSSVYFFYDPDYSFLSLGTYGSLREIAFVQQLAETVPALRYYYMGYYIHSCPKMRYKGRLVPSYLLCPEAYTWHLLDDAIRSKLDEHKYQRLNADPAARDADEFNANEHLSEVVLLHNRTFMTYGQYISSFNIQTIDNILDIVRSRIYKQVTGDDDERDSVIEYGKVVGKTLAHSMLFLKM